MKNPILIFLAMTVLLLAAGGDYASVTPNMPQEVEIQDIDESDETGSSEYFLSVDIFNASVHFSHLVFHSDLLTEFEFPQINETSPHSVIVTSLNFTKQYRTLFQRIISPNAP